jgi:sarcosine oxidase, subunit alpha
VTRQPHRLPADARHGFGGAEIDRTQPLSFRLNGISYEAFAGDTVLSALLAAGVDDAGTHLDETIGFSEHFAPPVAPVATAGDPASAIPMDRLPALPGLELRTLGPSQDRVRMGYLATRIASLFRRQPPTLRHRLDDPRAFEGPWLSLPPVITIETDIVVVGGGLAGMSAALAAAEAGQRVVLIERRAALGGDARIFGAVGDAEPPEATIARLAGQVAATDAITVLDRTDAFALSVTRVRAHQVEVTDGKLQGRVLAVQAGRVVLATGCAERLPVFSGNRAPGVVGAATAFHRAERYGVWRGKRAIFATPHNFAYRIAMLAGDAGISVQRVADSRISPQSRFIDFCKASGITLAAGLVPRSAETMRKEPQTLSVSFAVAIEDIGQDTAAMATDVLVAAGSWQPRLVLWLMAGGHLAYDSKHHLLAARGALDAVALAGSATGYRGTAACIESGRAAVAALLGGKAPPIEDQEIDAIYESRDGPTAIAPWRPGRGGAFLDGGLTFTPRPAQPSRSAPALVPEQMHVLSIGDVAAAVELGAIPAAVAGTVAEERCLGGGHLLSGGWGLPAGADAVADDELPAYLNGRFGAKPQRILIEASDPRYFEVGSLLYTSSDPADPFGAAGAIVAPSPQGRAGGIALVRHGTLDAGTLFVRDTGGAVPVRVVEKLRPQSAAPSETPD